MKKLICLFLLLACCDCVYAASGDVAGNIYYTDIKAYIYHSPITSYNIGGKTVIDAEILNWHYGFDVYWFADARRLEITDKGGRFESLQAMSGELVESINGKTGDVYGNYFETDIVTTLNGYEIESYNIGGRTFIVAEAMRDFGYDVYWNDEARTISINKTMDFYNIETDYGTLKTIDNCESSKSFGTYNRGIIVTDENNVSYEIATNSNRTYHGPYVTDNYVKLSDVQDMLSADVKLVETTTTSQTEWVNGVSYDEERYNYYIELNYDINVKPETLPVKDEYKFVQYEAESSYSINVGLTINGEECMIVGFNPKVMEDYPYDIRIIDGEIYIPIHTVAKILGYSHGN